MASARDSRLAPIGITFLADVDDEESRALLRSFEATFGRGGSGGGAGAGAGAGTQTTCGRVSSAASQGLDDEDEPLRKCETQHRRWHSFSYMTYFHLRACEGGSPSQEYFATSTLVVDKAEEALSDDEGSTVPATSAECTPLCSPSGISGDDVRIINLEGLVFASSADSAPHSTAAAQPPASTGAGQALTTQGARWSVSSPFSAAAASPRMLPPRSPAAGSPVLAASLHVDELLVPFAQVPRCPAPGRPADPAKLPPRAPWLRRPPTPLVSTAQSANPECPGGGRNLLELRERGNSVLLTLGAAPSHSAVVPAAAGGGGGGGGVRTALRERGQQFLQSTGRQGM